MKVLCLLSVLGVAAAAQTPLWVANVAPPFVDISTTGGTALLGVSDDSNTNITTTIGNAWFPAGTISVGNNGAICGVPNLYITYFNSAIPATGNPSGLSGAGILCPFWDDLYPQPGATNSTIYWKQDLVNGVLTIMWKNDNHFADGTSGAGPGITFEVNVYASGSTLFEYIYADTTFTGTYLTSSNGASATVGYAGGTTSKPNAPYSFNTASVTAPFALSYQFPGPPPPPLYQVNQTNATFTLNGTNGSSSVLAATAVTADNVCSFGSVNVVWSSALAGLPWDFAIAPGVVAANAGGLYLNGPPVQVVNVDLTLPYPVLTFLNNLALNNAFPAGPIAFPFAPGAPTNAGGQLVVLDPGSLDSVALSQPATYACTLVGSGINLPLSDDGAVAYSLSDPALCLSTGNFSFYGTNYTAITCDMNGRITMGGSGSAAGFSPSIAGALTGLPFCGCWADFYVQQLVTGNVHLSTPAAGIVQLDFINDCYFITSAYPTTWSIQLDQSTGNVTLGNAGLFPVYVGSSNNMFIGLSPGAAGGATDPGPAPWGLGFNGGPGPSDMNYNFGPNGTIVPAGVTNLQFINNGNGYDEIST